MIHRVTRMVTLGVTLRTTHTLTTRTTHRVSTRIGVRMGVRKRLGTRMEVRKRLGVTPGVQGISWNVSRVRASVAQHSQEGTCWSTSAQEAVK
jgi:hypothetical protein